eukprot:940959-Prymnesium_polylepis.2
MEPAHQSRVQTDGVTFDLSSVIQALQLNVKALDSSCSPSVKVEVLRSGTPFHGRTITEAVPITGVDGWVDVYW